jgi:glucose-1-phosphate cytidylyltransferase
MKVVILAGGYGTRISEESQVRPKPLVEIGGQPILWHIMKIYGAYGLTDFIICGGYKCHMLKSYFRDLALARCAVATFDFGADRIEIKSPDVEPWRVAVVDTGEKTMTGGRIRRIRDFLDEDEPFCLTYGDGVSDIDIDDLVAFHKRSGALATLTAVQPPGRFGALSLDPEERLVRAFREKFNDDGGLINGGFFVLDPAVCDYIDGDDTVWELQPMQTLAREGKLAAYRHRGFWQNMDTLRDKHVLDELWNNGEAPWKVWQ